MDILAIVQSVIFILGTITVVLISRKSLRSLNYHGFYRFFVFEFTLILVVLNFPHWFENPFSFKQIISWILLIVSLLLLAQSIYFFKHYGGVKKRRDNTTNFEFENTVTLIREGIYKYIRHPMYGSLLFLAFGVMLKYISILTISLAVATLIFIIFTAKTEEKENIKFFGTDYVDYMQTTKMFIPFVF